jgi:hypothetical protein
MILFVGGHGRKTGKTSLVCGLIRALPQARWTAVKVSRHRHPGIAGARILEQIGVDATDSGRYLAAGAVRSYWVAAEGDAVGNLADELRRLLAGPGNAIVESTSLAAWIKPDLFLLVIDPATREWKPSADVSLGLADAFVVVGRGPDAPSHPLPEDRPRFCVQPPEFVSDELVAFVSARLAAQAAWGSAATSES